MKVNSNKLHILKSQAEKKENELNAIIGKLIIELQKSVDFGTVQVDYLEGDGFGVCIEELSDVHISVEKFIELCENGEINEDDFMSNAFY